MSVTIDCPHSGLNSFSLWLPAVHSRQPSTDNYNSLQHNNGGVASPAIEAEFRQHLVVAVGSPLPTSSQPSGIIPLCKFIGPTVFLLNIPFIGPN